MTIRSHVIENQVVTNCDGQSFDGFTVVVEDDAEFGGSYNFTHACDAEMAHDAIFADNALNNEDGYLNQ